MEGVGVINLSGLNNTSTYQFDGYGAKQLIGAYVKETTIELAYRQQSNITYTGWPGQTAPDRVWKDVYGLKDGKMTLLKVVQGKHIQAQQIPESFEFDDE